jgi:hypothetical protein
VLTLEQDTPVAGFRQGTGWRLASGSPSLTVRPGLTTMRRRDSRNAESLWFTSGRLLLLVLAIVSHDGVQIGLDRIGHRMHPSEYRKRSIREEATDGQRNYGTGQVSAESAHVVGLGLPDNDD